MKKSIFLFFLWAITATVLTFLYLAWMMNRLSPHFPDIGWIFSLCIVLLTVAMMSLVRSNAKAERVLWLTVVSKILLIAYGAWGALSLIFFLLTRLIG